MATKKSTSGRKKSATRKKSTATRKKSTTTRKKSTTTRKKSTGARKKTGGRRKYSRAAGESVREEMHEMKRGRLRSGRSGKKVTSRKQAIAIGLSEARRKGEKVPAQRGRRKKSR
jgi:hypothetical protein